jgi:subtilisin family serine protease
MAVTWLLVLIMPVVAVPASTACLSRSIPLPSSSPFAVAISGAQQVEKLRIDSLEDLPRHSYTIEGKIADMVASSQAFAPFAAELRRNIESDLARYEIADKTTLRRWIATLVYLDMFDGRYDAALAGIQRRRELQDKPASKLTTGLFEEPAVAALRACGGDPANPTYRETFRRELIAKVDELPWGVVRDEVEQLRGMLQLFGENVIMGLIETQMQPGVDKTGELGDELAMQLVNIRGMLMLVLPVKEDIIEVLSQKIASHREVQEDIWRERSAALTSRDGGKPVLLAIWDTGVDVSLFADRLFTNPQEKRDGTDTDRNGFIDDVHGVGYDMWWQKSPDILYPLGDDESRVQEMLAEVKGYFDLQANVDSPEAGMVKQKFSTMGPNEVKTFLEDFMRCALYIHGTHVAGIAIDGNPSARLLVARMEEDYHSIPRPPTKELASAMATAFKETVEYFKIHSVRAVNMSWGIGLKETETQLERNGIGETAEERAEMAREIFAIMKDGLYSAIAGAADILFVVAAGNFDEDVAFRDDCPASFDLPNILAVGAVDREGKETAFTSFGKRVRVYSNGFEVDSYVPGGKHMAFSGTSMASPNVINLAAKLLALDPSLGPSEIIELIEAGATRGGGSKELLLIHPKHTLELLEQRQSSSTDNPDDAR